MQIKQKKNQRICLDERVIKLFEDLSMALTTLICFNMTRATKDIPTYQRLLSLYIRSSKIQGNTSDHYMNHVVFLMERSEVLSD